MKKSILSFGSIMILLLLIFSCTKEQENVKLSDEGINLKGEVNKEKQEADERGVYKVTHLLTYLHSYIKAEVSEDYTYYEKIPERKEVDWFFENFKKNFKSGSEADNWTLEKIKSGEIYIFGTTVKDVTVAALIFSEGLDIHERFEGKRGFFFDTDTPVECNEIVTSFGRRGGDCMCVIIWSCYNFGRCGQCANNDENINLEDLFDLDEWIINDFDFEKFGGLPVSKINIGDPVLQLKRK